MLINLIKKYFNNYLNAVVLSTDSKALRLKKSSLIIVPLIIGPAALVWGILYIFLGQYVSASIPLSYSVISLFNLCHLYKTKNIILLQQIQMILVLFLPFFLMWSLGGFASGSFVMLWAFFAPIAALIYEDSKKSLYWFYAFIVLVVFSTVIDQALIESRTTFLSQTAIELFFLLNSSAALAGVFLLIKYFINEKDKNAHECLEEEHRELALRSEELNKANIKLKALAHYDSLTGLPNRALFNDRLSQAIEKAKRHKNELALLFVDLDRFKPINDSLGHALGDKVLQAVASRLHNSIRKEDSLARLGGDEFIILMDDLNKGENASLLAQKIIDCLAVPIYIDEHTLYVTASIGISLYPHDDIDMNKLIMYADTAMYKAKKGGKNNFQFYSTEMTALAVDHVVMQANLHTALEKEEFVVYYQPQINAETLQHIGMEALVRWEHPSMGLITPSKFLSIAEETGFIVALDQWVMKMAMKQMVQWYKEGFNPGVLALNLSIKQLHQKDFISVFKGMLIETGCRAEWLELEVAEGQIMNHPEDAISVLNKLGDMGIELAIDDFGTGYSSLSYLKRLPIDKLKIDKTFIDGLPDDEEDVGIAKAIIALAKSLKLGVIAEGVETEEQRDFLLEHGCENIQGYFYGKPMLPHELEKCF
ncbi:MAG: EAL domain-containing protein [Sulfurovum sp.]|uniref:putative bifunctional diguanylate cyclase/phosphodiesterase n=1 Tax=Sulfurovum sp. TaxID=1969726 RepID=UPI002868280E|nr:EAL domain-containing protein [Sulfurovum sp.]MCO4844783.1 EAL domain-containing protein [Sulfurovum sp.]